MLSKEELKAQAAVLRLNFPVSSGMQHRARESEWKLVTTGSATSTTATATDAHAKPQQEVCVHVLNVVDYTLTQFSSIQTVQRLHLK